MTYPVWISQADTCPEENPVPGAADGPWQEIGFLDSSTETDITRKIQQRLGIRSSASNSAKGYIAAYVDHPWVREVLERNPSLRHGARGAASDSFWLTIDATAGAGQRRFLTALSPVHFATLERRPPESHPGWIAQVVMLPIQIRAQKGVVFR